MRKREQNFRETRTSTMVSVAEEPVVFAGPDPVVLRADQPAGGMLASEPALPALGPGAHTESKWGFHRVSFL